MYTCVFISMIDIMEDKNNIKKAILYKKLPEQKVVCLTCNHYCTISPDYTGKCGIRQNKNGELYLLTYGKALWVNVDPIEKKPLYHFFPWTNIFSFGTAGCNFTCKFCQNRQMSQAKVFPEIIHQGESRSPKKIVDFCVENKIWNIAYTYNEPTVFFEYAYDTMKLAKKHGIKNVRVTNGFMSKECLKKIEKLVDAVNIDIKWYTEEFYKDICGARLQPILDNIKRCREHDIWTEVTTLVIPGYNDKDADLEWIAKFIYSVSPDIPWHLSVFYPVYKMLNVPETKIESLKRWYDIGKKIWLNYIYLGNIYNNGHEDTICPKCWLHLISRTGYSVQTDEKFKDGMCPKCKTKIAGRRED